MKEEKKNVIVLKVKNYKKIKTKKMINVYLFKKW